MTELVPDFIEEPLRNPSEILLPFSDALSMKTNGAVVSEVIKMDDDDFDTFQNCDFNYIFRLVGPLIENYRFTICRFGHDISIYPTFLRFDSEIARELNLPPFANFKVDSAEQFEEVMMKVFRTVRIASVVNSIRQLSKAGRSF